MIVQKELYGEDKHVEFKAEIPKKHDKFLKDIIAFANTSGGKIFVGIEDETGVVLGLGDMNPFRLSDMISNMISDACTPQINVEIAPKTIGDKTVLEVEVFHGRYCPYFLKSVGKEKSSYIRVNGTSRPADARKLRELELEGQQISYDTMREIGVTYDEDVAKALMDSMYQTALAASRTDEEREDVHPLTVEKLEDFGILTKEGRDYVPTHAFTLLTNPIDRNIKIQCALFKGIDRDEFIDKKEFRGSIQTQVEEAYQFVLRHISRSAVIEGLYRHDTYELPTKSIREIIANACLHRSYLDSSAIQVSIYDDRIEVDSPGMLYDGLNITEALSGKSKCRNTAIAEAFQYMKIIEGWGTGLPRLFRQCMEMGLPKPRFEEFGDGIKVTIFRNREDKEKTKNNKEQHENHKETAKKPQRNHKEIQTEIIDITIPDGLADVEKDIINLVLQKPRITMGEMSVETGWTQWQIRYYVERLKKNGTLIREGATKNGRWIVKGGAGKWPS